MMIFSSSALLVFHCAKIVHRHPSPDGPGGGGRRWRNRTSARSISRPEFFGNKAPRVIAPAIQKSS